MLKLYVTWVVEAMFGPNTHAELTRPESYRGYRTERGINLIRIASRGNEQSGAFHICPKEVRNIAWDWGDVELNYEKLCRRVIGEICYHTSTYFGSAYQLKTLRDGEGWLVLQVQYDSEKPRYGLYPSFTAFLQRLAEITRRPIDDLVIGGKFESDYANNCRRK